MKHRTIITILNLSTLRVNVFSSRKKAYNFAAGSICFGYSSFCKKCLHPFEYAAHSSALGYHKFRVNYHSLR